MPLFLHVFSVWYILYIYLLFVRWRGWALPRVRARCSRLRLYSKPSLLVLAHSHCGRRAAPLGGMKQIRKGAISSFCYLGGGFAVLGGLGQIYYFCAITLILFNSRLVFPLALTSFQFEKDLKKENRTKITFIVLTKDPHNIVLWHPSYLFLNMLRKENVSVPWCRVRGVLSKQIGY